MYSSKIINFIECSGGNHDNNNNTNENNSNSSLIIDIINPSLAFNSIERYLLNVLIRRRPRRKTLEDILFIANRCGLAKVVLKNLRSRGVIGYSERGRLFAAAKSRRLSTINFGPTVHLEQHIRSIALNGIYPDAYFLSLLTVSLIGDDNENRSVLDKALENFVQRNEYRVAHENLKTTVRTQASVRRSSKFVLKKFSRDVHSERVNFRKTTSEENRITF